MRLPVRAILLLAVAGTFAAAASAPVAAQVAQGSVTGPAPTLPERLSDAEFWKLMGDISEPGGYFRMADNFVSNERDIGIIAGQIRDNGPNGGVYLGVGPEQNLTYIAAVRPKMVFIVDIRRQAVMQHLLYKAIFELSRDRIDFVSLLFAKPRPVGLSASSTIIEIWGAYSLVPMEPALALRNRVLFRDHLTKTHGFALTAEELEALDHVQNSFAQFGPGITTSGPGRGGILSPPYSGAPGDSGAAARYRASVELRLALNRSPTEFSESPFDFIALSSVTDAAGEYNSFLANEDAFRFLKELHSRNLFVPNSGNFGGPKAIRAVAAYAKERGAAVTAFYVSNVESYLFTDGIAGAFYDNVAALPVNEKSVFIRPGGFRVGAALCPIAGMLRSVAAGAVTNNSVAVRCGQ